MGMKREGMLSMKQWIYMVVQNMMIVIFFENIRNISIGIILLVKYCEV